jgi:hypothetical protein
VKWALALLAIGCGSSATVSPDGAAGGAGDSASVADTGGAQPDTGKSPDTAVSPDMGMAMTGKSLDDCFTGLRALAGASQDTTRASADGKYKVRLALETADRGGTSGSSAWAAIRFAIETPEGTVCVSDESALATAYMGTHHNCMDVLTVNAGGLRYVIRNPDTAVDYTDPTKYRREGSLTIFMGATMVAGPITMQTVKCNKSSRAGGICSSGGPC